MSIINSIIESTHKFGEEERNRLPGLRPAGCGTGVLFQVRFAG